VKQGRGKWGLIVPGNYDARPGVPLQVKGHPLDDLMTESSKYRLYLCALNERFDRLHKIFNRDRHQWQPMIRLRPRRRRRAFDT